LRKYSRIIDFERPWLFMGRCDKGPIKIIHIDREYRVVYWIFLESGIIKSTVSLSGIVNLLKKERFDLIISEPHSLYIMDSPYK
jgi:hypothetical protein